MKIIQLAVHLCITVINHRLANGRSRKYLNKLNYERNMNLRLLTLISYLGTHVLIGVLNDRVGIFEFLLMFDISFFYVRLLKLIEYYEVAVFLLEALFFE